VTDDRPGSGNPGSTSPAGTGSAGPAKDTPPAEDGQRGPLLLRPDTSPAGQLDYDDRHVTRATESDDYARRYADYYKDRRKDDWHRLAIGLVMFVAGVAVYLAGTLVMSHLLPHSTPRQATQIVAYAFVAAGGGVAGRSAGRTLRQRYARSRGQGSAGLTTAASPSSPPAQDRLGEQAAGKCCHDGHQHRHHENPARAGEPARYSTQTNREHDDAAEPGGNDGGGAD
jgi:hypothetical protein